jgi:hypothetical protein
MDRRKATLPLKRKALEPHQRYCRFVDKKVSVLVEYVDYKTPFNKGEEGTLYCGNMLECYHKQVCCRYSGISPLYPDPFQGAPKDYSDEDGEGESEREAPSQPEEPAEEIEHRLTH